MAPAGQASKVKSIYLYLSAERGTAVIFWKPPCFLARCEHRVADLCRPAALGRSPPIHLPVNCRLS